MTWRSGLGAVALMVVAAGAVPAERVRPVRLATAAPTIADGDDFTLPAWVTPSASGGFYSELAAPEFDVLVHSVDCSWRQLNPSPGVYSRTTAGAAQGMNFPSLDQQLAQGGPVWMRIFASGVDWAPAFLASECGVEPVGEDDDGEGHLPIWDPCVWQHLLDLYRQLFVGWDLRNDERLRFVYVPGAFAWCEFDFDLIEQAVSSTGLTYAEFDAWFQPAMRDLVAVMNGEDLDPTDDRAYKLVYTGEDYPFGPWDEDDDLFARDAVLAGMGIRTGITELFNFHLNQIPAYGTTIAADGHLTTDEEWVLFDGKRVIGTENECYNDCGYHSSDPYYAVKMSNLKALQMRVNWLYVVPEASYMAEYDELWRWVRLELGRTAATSPDAWAALRRAEDRYWVDDTSHDWDGRPWVQNLERWLVQRDVQPDGVSRDGTDVRTGVVDPDNGTAYEGRRTDLAHGSDSLYFDLDDRFLHDRAEPVEVKVTYLDRGSTAWWLEYAGTGGVTRTATVTNQGSAGVRTVTFPLDDARFDGSLTSGCDFRLRTAGPDDLEVRFVRVVKLVPPTTEIHRPSGRRP